MVSSAAVATAELHLEKGMRMFMERTFAERLQDAMRQRGFKQVDLVREADKYGVKLGKSHMSQYVSGKTVPRAEILRFLANCLQVDADWLLTGEGDSRMVAGNTIHKAKESFQILRYDYHDLQKYFPSFSLFS